jgi:putative ABC transport system permease protein
MKQNPPKYFLHFFRWYCHPRMQDYIEGDLMEVYEKRKAISGKTKADLRFMMDVILLFRPGIIRPTEGYQRLNTYGMYKSYFKIGWRNLVKDKGYSFINIGGLAMGIAVAILIGLWVNDEFSFDKDHENYNTIAAVLQNNTIDGNIETWSSQSYQLGPELRDKYGSNFKRVVMSSFPVSSILTDKEKVFTVRGSFMEPDGPDLLSLKMVHGVRTGLQDPTSILLSSSVANNFFGEDNPVGKILRIDNSIDLKVAGVYQELPSNSSFRDELNFIAHLDVLVNRGGRSLGWFNNWLQVFVQVEDKVDIQQVSAAIKDAKLKNVSGSEAGFKPELFIFPLSRWHLHSDFQNGINVGGHIEVVWLFGAIGVFILLLASINFMNLSTARSQKRAKEVGVRKVIGSARGQLIGQFFSESFLVVSLAFIFALLLVQLSLPWFNTIAEKNLEILWSNPTFWFTIITSVFVIAIVSGIYPALFLSGFKPIHVLKGVLNSGHSALPRKVLVVVQFSISIILTIGTIIVYQQIQHAKNRPLGYELNGLVTIPMKTQEVKDNFNSLRNELLTNGTISEVSKSETTIMNLWWSDKGFKWRGKDPNLQDVIFRGGVDYEFGKTIGWKIKEGRDFSRNFSDSTSIILNESAVKYMGFEDPIGEIIGAYGKNYTVIGVVEDMITQSLYTSPKQTIFALDPYNAASYISVKLDPNASTTEALEEMNRVFVKLNPNTPFEYTFAEDEFAGKFAFEKRVGQLVGIFATLAVLISCLGLFGLASFIAEQRTKEIGVRKVLGASVFKLWKMLSKDFVGLVLIAVCIAIPIAYYLMSSWLLSYEYRTEIGWGIFVLSGIGALLITLITVSYQAIKAASINPVSSLRSE